MASFPAGPTNDPSRAVAGTIFRTPLRLAVALGDPERERALLPYLVQQEDFTVSVRCLAAEELLKAAQDGRFDVAVVATDLHRLLPATVADLGRTGVQLVVLAPTEDLAMWEAASAAVLSVDIEPEKLIATLTAVARGERPPARMREAGPNERDAIVDAGGGSEEQASSVVLAVTSGAGSPGRTTLGLNLAAALGAVAPTILVDADLGGASVAAHLDADPTRNLAMLAHTDPDSPRAWERAIADETQLISPRSPHGRVLCGVPKPEMQGLLSRRFLDRLVDELSMRNRYVLLDVGADGLRGETALHRLALAAAHHTLFVTSADLVGLFRARASLGRAQPDGWHDRIAVVINRHDPRFHHGRAEIEWALGCSVAAVIPNDYDAVQRALFSQRPLVLGTRGRAARALLDLAERVHGGSIRLPPEPATPHRRGIGRLGFPARLRPRTRVASGSQAGGA